jgi:hypothetical protein
MKLKFLKVNNQKYVLNETHDVINKAQAVLEDISGGNSATFETNNNTMLFDSIVSRIVSNEFLKQYINNIDETNFVSIDISLPERVLIISCGYINVNNEIKKLNGVLYK